jgi:large subunit ribosomal protein L15
MKSKPKAPAKQVKPATKPVLRKKKFTPKEVKTNTQLIGLHALKTPRGAHKKKKLLGRGSGSGHGKTSTRGSKGQTSRAGRHFYLGFEGGQSPIIRRFPKRGFTNIFKKEYQIVNLEDIVKLKESAVNPEILKKKGLIKDKGKRIKILGDGELKSAIAVSAHAFSRKASEKITGAGGKIEIIHV